LRVENNSLRDEKEIQDRKRRKIGSITQSCRKISRGQDNAEIGKRNEFNIEDKLLSI
jgi:hypothetical protein